MKKITLLFVFTVLFLSSCKKDSVDATNLKTFQSSVNDMASELNTLQQYKFNEALYILKTFGVEAEGDVNELTALSKLINGKKTPEIFAMADQVALQNGIAWTSVGPPSLGEMNIFGNEKASERDPKDVSANAINLITKNISVDSLLGPKALQIIPRLTDAAGKPIVFEEAALETTMEIFSNGTKLSTSKNLMQNNNFKGFTLRFSSLPATKITDNKIDITVSVKTKDKTLRMSKIGVPINPKALQKPVESVPTEVQQPSESKDTEGQNTTDPATQNTTVTNNTTTDPKITVQKFLNNISSQNLKAAYDAANNPNWGSYEKFANPTSGFGSVKNLSIKNISTTSKDANSASVNASYDVTDKNGNTSTIKVTFGLKNTNGDWKISSYKIN